MSCNYKTFLHGPHKCVGQECKLGPDSKLKMDTNATGSFAVGHGGRTNSVLNAESVVFGIV